MTRLGRCVVVAAASMAVACAVGDARQHDIADRADAYLKAQADAGFFSGAALIARDGVPLFAEAYGEANLEWSIPNSVGTRFRIASIAKTFTAALVLRLEEQGRLSVGDRLCTYLESCPDAWGLLTIHHLLTHTSGIPDYVRLPDFASLNRLPYEPDRIVGLVRDRPLEVTAGERYSYSNVNYLLLGMVLERVSGLSYEQLLHEQLLGPLGMPNTGIDRASTVVPNRASGYVPDGAQLANADYIDMRWVFGAGEIYSTVGDLLVWEQAVRNGRVVRAETLARMWRADRGEYGYGWQVLRAWPPGIDKRLVLHAGGVNGFATDLLSYPDDGVTIVILANLMTAPMAVISRDLSAIVFGADYVMPVVRRAIHLDPSVYDTYAGDYELAPGVTINVRREGERLVVQATGQPADVAIPESESRFFSRTVDAQMTFVKDADGRVTHLTLHAGGRDSVARRR